MVNKYNCSGRKLFKFGKVQIELWICSPQCFIPLHSHPNLDSHIIHVWGRALMMKENRAVISRLFSFFRYYNIHKGVEHGLQNFDGRFIFLSFEVWNIEPTSAAINLVESTRI